MPRIRPLLLLLVLLLSTAQAHRAKVAATPDFLQTDPEAGLAKAGSQFCAPAAVSNSLMWLAANGYDDLRPAGNAKAAQIRLIRKLAGRDYMNTSPSAGTDVMQVLNGVASYVDEAGYSIASLSYEGWRSAPEEYAAGEHPDLDSIRESVVGDTSAVWLNVGWYVYDEDSGDYERRGGHWVTVVGFAGDDLLIHDPAPSAGRKKWTQRIELTALAEGRLTGNQRGLPRDAAGYYEAGGEMRVGNGMTCIVDGAVMLTLE